LSRQYIGPGVTGTFRQVLSGFYTSFQLVVSENDLLELIMEIQGLKKHCLVISGAFYDPLNDRL
jgi:hypothetical protein